jgi:hypothetical protein
MSNREAQIETLRQEIISLSLASFMTTNPQPISNRIREIRERLLSLEFSASQESTKENLVQQSYETLIKQIYNIHVEIPQFLIINKIKINFISFQDAANMLQNNQIQQFFLNPLLQSYAGLPSSPNRIVTLLDKNGMSYLVKAKYDRQTNQIFPSI